MQAMQQESSPMEDSESSSESTSSPGTKRSTAQKRKINFACTECRKAHKGCNGERPCQRCKKLGIEDRCKSTARKKNRVLANKYWKSIINATATSPSGGVSSPTYTPSPQEAQQAFMAQASPSHEQFHSSSAAATQPQRSMVFPAQTAPNTVAYNNYFNLLLNAQQQAAAAAVNTNKVQSPPQQQQDRLSPVQLQSTRRASNATLQQIQQLQQQFQQFQQSLQQEVDGVHHHDDDELPHAPTQQVPEFFNMLHAEGAQDDVFSAWYNQAGLGNVSLNADRRSSMAPVPLEDDTYDAALELLQNTLKAQQHN
jgi:hypothetical protein